MSRYNLQIAKLIIYDPQRSDSFVSCFIAQPEISEQERLGQIFVLSEFRIKGNPAISRADCQKFLDAAIKSIKNNYYQPGYVSETIELAFESALQKTNQELKNYFSGQKSLLAQNFLENLNILIGAMKRHEVHFSYIGHIEAHIIHNNKISSICSGLNNERGEDLNQSQRINPFKIFSYIVSGHLEPDNGLLLSTENLLDYFSLEKLKKTIIENNPNGACQNLQVLLSELDDRPGIAVIVAKLQTQLADKKNELIESSSPKKISGPKKTNIEDSIVELLSRQEETNRILTPSLKPLLKKIIFLGWLVTLIKKIIKKLPWQKQHDQEKNIIKTLKTYVQKSQPKISHFPKNKIKSRFLKNVLYPIEILRTTVYKIWEKIDRRKSKIYLEFKRPKRYFLKLPLSSKALLFLLIILGALFVQSIIQLNKRQIKEKEIKTYNFILSKIEELQDSAAAALIYKDEQKARKLYKNAEKLIKELPRDSKKHQEKAEILTLEIQAALDKINKLKKILEPKILTDLSRLSFFKSVAEDGVTVITVKPKKIIKIENAIYTFRPDNGLFYTIDLITSEVKNLGNIQLGTDKITTLRNWNNDYLLVYSAPGNISKFDLEEKKIIPQELKSRTGLYVQDLIIYDDKLYLLAPNKNLILKYYKTLAGFGQETLWLKDETSVRDAISLAVDGSAWVLLKDGQIVNLMKGVNQEFNFTELEPPLLAPTKIWTSADSDYLYLLDPPTKRLVILTKEGKIKEQLTSDAFDELGDFIVDEDGGKIYILNGMKIYEVLLKE